MVVAPGQDGPTRRRAQGRGVHIGVAQALGREAVEHRGLHQAAERRQLTEADVIKDEEHHVRRTLRRARGLRPRRAGRVGRPADDPRERGALRVGGDGHDSPRDLEFDRVNHSPTYSAPGRDPRPRDDCPDRPRQPVEPGGPEPHPRQAPAARMPTCQPTTSPPTRPLPPARVKGPPSFHVLAKPTGAICNLDCDYCFFLAKEELYPGSTFRMTEPVLEAYVAQLLAAHRTPEVTIAWQGGEPTMMGLDFYRHVLDLVDAHRRPGQMHRAHHPDQRHPHRRRVGGLPGGARLPGGRVHRRARAPARRLPEGQGRQAHLRAGGPRAAHPAGRTGFGGTR